jgi:hypothetical protein
MHPAARSTALVAVRPLAVTQLQPETTACSWGKKQRFFSHTPTPLQSEQAMIQAGR